MIFKISKKNKDDIQKKISKDKKSVRITREIGRWILIIGVLSGLIYLALNILIPSWGLVSIRGVAQKDYGSIIAMALTIILPSIVLFLCMKALMANLSSSNNTERIDEVLILDSDILKYTFRIIYQSNPKDRNVITIPLNKIQQVSYNADKKSMLLRGSILSDYVEDFGIDNTSSELADEINEILIYDYFKPSLLDTLEEREVNIQREVLQ